MVWFQTYISKTPNSSNVIFTEKDRKIQWVYTGRLKNFQIRENEFEGFFANFIRYGDPSKSTPYTWTKYNSSRMNYFDICKLNIVFFGDYLFLQISTITSRCPKCEKIFIEALTNFGTITRFSKLLHRNKKQCNQSLISAK